MLSFQGSLTERWEMFISVGLGLVLDLRPCKTALQRLGWLELGQRKLLPDFWPVGSRGTGQEQTSAGVERTEGAKVRRVLLLPRVAGWRSLERQRACCQPACQNRCSEHGCR